MVNCLYLKSFITTCHRSKINMFLIIQRSFKWKKKQEKPPVAASDRAIEYFDIYYKPVYQELWPSIRISLLTAKKTCAVMNTFVRDNQYIDEFQSQSAYNMINAASKIQAELAKIATTVTDNENEQLLLKNRAGRAHSVDTVCDTTSHDYVEEAECANNITKTGVLMEDSDRTDLSEYVPTKTVYYETDNLKSMEKNTILYTPTDLRIDKVKPKRISLPHNLQVMTFPRGNVSKFPDPVANRTGGKLCFFMMDAASILPVLALDLEEGDSVLDLCAAPGGKALCILQTSLVGNFTANDISRSRLNRLHSIINLYVPEESRSGFTISCANGLGLQIPQVNKVLVDVPCNTDRHMALVDENNLFNPTRSTDRINMPKLQRDLLISGIKSCRPGGSIVYSTCTLAPSQNDGVVQNALEEIWRQSNIDVVIEDLSEIHQLFKREFNFYKGCRYGQLVVPSLSSNFGPMYICRIKRLS